jgi:hypothetical protein
VNLQFEALRCNNKYRRLEVTVSFDQPQQVREGAKTQEERQNMWERSKRLTRDALVCILDGRALLIFCLVVEETEDQKARQGNQDDNGADESRVLPRDLFSDPARAYATLTLADHEDRKFQDLAEQFMKRHLGYRLSLVEFPGVILPTFQPTLEALQKMTQTADLPFGGLLAPQAYNMPINIDPPLYAQQRGFNFDLSCVLEGSHTLSLSPTRPVDMDSLLQYSTLDNTQATAVVECLTRRLALMQGPPGTGKSYTGVTLARILLANKEQAKLGPIICVCYTNHALDQILEHLLNAEIKQIIRIGSQSKSKILEPLNLRVVS